MFKITHWHILKEEHLIVWNVNTFINLPDHSILSEYYDKISASEYQIKNLSEVLQPRASTQENGIKLLPLKQMLERFLILISKVNTCNTSRNLMNETRQILY